MEEESISSNTCGYIKIDKLFIKDVDKLYEKYLIIKEILKKEIIQELSDQELSDQELSNQE